MKSLFLILISLLFVLVASKTEKNGKSLFSIAKTIFSEEEGEEDNDPCHSGFDPKTCKTITNGLLPSTQCCYMKGEVIDYDDMSINICERMIKLFVPFSDLIKSPKFFPFAREMLVLLCMDLQMNYMIMRNMLE